MSRPSTTSTSGLSGSSTNQNPKDSKQVSMSSCKDEQKSSSSHSSKSSSQTPSKSTSDQSQNSATSSKKHYTQVNGTLHTSPALDRYAHSRTRSNPQYAISSAVVNEDASRSRVQVLLDNFDREMEFYGEEPIEEAGTRH